MLDDANFYNAAKHGLAVLAGTQQIRMFQDDQPENVIFDHSGPALEILESGADDQGAYRWRLATNGWTPRPR